MLKHPSLEKIICVSAIAAFALPVQTVIAAPTIICTQNISFGIFLPNCNGSITVRGTPGSATMNNGCHSAMGGAIRPAICNIQTTLATATMDARVTFTAPNVQFSNTTGAGLMTLDNFRIQTAGGSVSNTHTFNNSLLNPSHDFRVGGRLRFDNAETKGAYNSGIDIVVTSIP